MKRNVTKGTPEQFLNLVQNKIAELGGGVEACDNITASTETTYIDDSGIMGEIGHTWTVSQLRQYWDAEQMNDPVLYEYDSFDSWLKDTTSNMTEMDFTSDYDKYSKDWIAQIKNKLASVGVDVNSPEAEDYAEAAAELIAEDDNHDVDYWWQETQADQTFMDEVDALPHIHASTNITSARDDDSTYDDRFIHTLIGDVQTELYNEVDGLTIDAVGDSLNIVTVNDGNVTEFNVPNADLSFDFDTIADDVSYIVSTIRETLYPDVVNSSEDIDDDIDDDYEISEDTHDMIADTCWEIITNANNILSEKYGLDEPADYESREVNRDGEKITCTLWLSELSDDTTIDITWSYRKDELVLNGSVESYGAAVAEIYAEDYGYSYEDIESATNTCGIACKPEILSSVTGDVIHGLTWGGLIQELSERGYKVDAAYRRSPDKHITAYKDGKTYDIEVTQYSEGDYEVVLDNISEVIEADTDIVDDEYHHDASSSERYLEIESKQVPDSNGFYTEYTMYFDTHTGKYVFVFGDSDIYRPEDGNLDWECETEPEAREWFDSYEGFVDIYETTDIDNDHTDVDSLDSNTKQDLLAKARKICSFTTGDNWFDITNKQRVLLNIRIASDVDDYSKIEQNASEIFGEPITNIWWDDYVLVIDVTDWFANDVSE